jgi:hypothetical protein
MLSHNFQLLCNRNLRNQENIKVRAYNYAMSDMLSQIFRLLVDVVVPSLKGIQASQAEQRLQTEHLGRSLEDFRAEMRVKFTEVRAEIAASRLQVEDAMVTLREAESAKAIDSVPHGKKTLIH